jgi:hypothetical protein
MRKQGDGLQRVQKRSLILAIHPITPNGLKESAETVNSFLRGLGKFEVKLGHFS